MPPLDICLSFGCNFVSALLKYTPLSVVEEITNNISGVEIQSPTILGIEIQSPTISDIAIPSSIVSEIDIPFSTLTGVDIPSSIVLDIDTLSPTITGVSTQPSYFDTILNTEATTTSGKTTQSSTRNRKRKGDSPDRYPGSNPESLVDIKKRRRAAEIVVDLNYCPFQPQHANNQAHLYDELDPTCTNLSLIFPLKSRVQYNDNGVIRMCLMFSHTSHSRFNHPYCYRELQHEGVTGIFVRPTYARTRTRYHNIRVTNKGLPVIVRNTSMFLRR